MILAVLVAAGVPQKVEMEVTSTQAGEALRYTGIMMEKTQRCFLRVQASQSVSSS